MTSAGHEADEQGGIAAPVVIGGLGGSGTRAVASVLRTCGLQMVGPLNAQFDNQWVTMMFKRPRWLPRLLAGQRPVPEIVEAFGVLRAMFSGRPLDQTELWVLAAAAADCAALGYGSSGDIRWWAPPTPFRFVTEYLAKPPAGVGESPWGWKEPVSHVMLPELVEAFPGVRYVHVVRDPFDMAWSSNTQGVRLWGALCGMDGAKIDAFPHDARLAWWLYSTRCAVAKRDELGERFLLVRFEQLCEDPAAGAGKLATFAGLEPTDALLAQAAAQIEPPATIGRQNEHDLDSLDPQLRDEARAWLRALDGGVESLPMTGTRA